jgi:hypothetical protein
MTLARAAVLLALAAPAALPLCAQTPISVGQTIRGTLDAADPQHEKYGQPYEAYVIRGRPGERVVVEMRSEDFDAFLRWGRRTADGWEEVRADDGGGIEGHDARLIVALGAEGEHELRALGFSWDDEGAYELQVTLLAEVPADTIRIGQTVRGELADGDFQGNPSMEDHYLVSGPPGSVATLTADSDEMDTMLAWGRWENWALTELGGDDGSAPGHASRIVVRFPDDGTYHVVVRTRSVYDRYTLRMEAGERP